MDTPIIETPEAQEQFGNGEETPPTEAPQVTEGTPPASEDGNETPPAPSGSETEDGFETPPAPTYYTPEEMKTLQVDGIDTSRIPPEMVPLYQAMQSPITRKSQQLSDELKKLEQGIAPLQDPQHNPQTPQQPAPSMDEIALNVTMNKLGLQQKPEPWDANYENYVLELADTRREIKDSATKHNQAMNELNTFKAGFTPEQFKQIDSQAETKMYKLLSDPSTQAEGQRIQRAMQTGDTKTITSFVREVAKEVLRATPNANPKRYTPPVTTTPQGSQVSVGGKDPEKMTNAEYRAYRNSQS